MNIDRCKGQNWIFEDMIDGNGQSLDSTLSLIYLVYIFSFYRLFVKEVIQSETSSSLITKQT